MAVQSKLYKEAIREFHGIYYLLKLCKEGDQKTKEEAVTALRNCCAFSSANRTHFREKGGIQILGTLLRSHHPGIVLNAAATLANISCKTLLICLKNNRLDVSSHGLHR